MKQLRPAEQASIPMVQHALSYARTGWPVFPLAGKIPYKDSKGFRDATTDELQIQAMWAVHPIANIGLATGERSGVIVLDIDPRHNGWYSLKELEKRYGKLPQTRTSRTANGGLHRFFAHPKDANTYPNAIELDHLRGLDVRGDRGYVVLPPSKLFGKLTYKWGQPQLPIADAPKWLLELLTTAKQQRDALPQDFRFADRPGEKWLTQALGRANEGNRNQVGFQLACQLRDDGISEATARDILLAYVQQVPAGKTAYTEREALVSVRSAYSRPPRPPARRNG
jgi:Bifunctional DNA primase/polymerase, N-terminal